MNSIKSSEAKKPRPSHKLKGCLLTVFIFIHLWSFSQTKKQPYILILGNVQDAGSPHIGCEKSCCKILYDNPQTDRMVVSLGIVDPETKRYWLVEATPDMPKQLKALQDHVPFNHAITPDGIFLTHAHIGHYTGLMYLGHEALASRQTNVYAMPGMKTFLTGNGPWSQLVKFENIELLELQNDSTIRLSSNLTIKPFLVPHRDEYSETVGYKITGPKKEVLFIPDINKWDVWDRSIVDEIKKVDYALLDATFFDGAEINHRDIREIPHPFVIESMLLFEALPMQERDKIHFIHFNHTNPLLNSESKQTKKVEEAGYNVSRFLQVIEL